MKEGVGCLLCVESVQCVECLLCEYWKRIEDYIRVAVAWFLEESPGGSRRDVSIGLGSSGSSELMTMQFPLVNGNNIRERVIYYTTTQ